MRSSLIIAKQQGAVGVRDESQGPLYPCIIIGVGTSPTQWAVMLGAVVSYAVPTYAEAERVAVKAKSIVDKEGFKQAQRYLQGLAL
ncbi:hypothetical protein FDH29_gp14 [Aquamicrobium phage P14]|uniref:Uncharacterized protein n=1 Tax=Aquamicrobium phage P14 TaxID=1927013 RepID=A0A1L5C042_9CAUD|nr:hypothetical protein FDH29_gp14 [Aquamicrobium phage P14]APL99472.1 hypothetical protein BB738_0140 [Aquamicrobium phage P14]